MKHWRHNAGIYIHMPGGLEEMPLPHPRNINRLSTLHNANLTTARINGSPKSIFASLRKLSPFSKENKLDRDGSEKRLSRTDLQHPQDHRKHSSRELGQSHSMGKGDNNKDMGGEEWCYASSAGKGIEAVSAATSGAGRVLNAVTNTAAGFGDRAMQEAQDVAEVLGHRSEGSATVFGRRSSSNSSSSQESSSGQWSIWHMFGCVAVQSTVRAESGGSDEEEA